MSVGVNKQSIQRVPFVIAIRKHSDCAVLEPLEARAVKQQICAFVHPFYLNQVALDVNIVII